MAAELTPERMTNLKFAYMSAKAQGNYRMDVGREDFGDLIEAAEENARLRAEVERLQGEIHECPKCGRACKECDRTEQRIATLEAELAKVRGIGVGDEVFIVPPPGEAILGRIVVTEPAAS